MGYMGMGYSLGAPQELSGAPSLTGCCGSSKHKHGASLQHRVKTDSATG